eukprot:8660075-Pyramimonas_sp.AAC.1
MRLSRAPFAGNPAGVDAAGAPAVAADSAMDGMRASAVGVAACGSGRVYGGAAGCPVEAAGVPDGAIEPAIMAVILFSSSR